MFKMQNEVMNRIIWMLVIIIILFTCGILTAYNLEGKSLENERQVSFYWEKVNQIKVSHSVFYGGFFDQIHGVTVGYHGATYTTNDGGLTWIKGDNEANCRYGLDWLDLNYIWTVGNYGGNRVSLNGGRSLFAVSDLPLIKEIPNNLVDIVSQQVVWVGAINQLAVTNDAGFTFSNIQFPEQLNGLAAISFVSENTGCILDFSGNLFQTLDGGMTWASIGKLPIALTIMHDEVPTATMRLDDQLNGKVVFRGSDRKLYAFITDDHCQSFKEVLFNIEERGLPYLSKDSATLTLTDYLGVITLYQFK